LGGSPSSSVPTAAFSPDDRFVALGRGSSLRLWDRRSSDPPRALEIPWDAVVQREAFGGDGSMLVAEVAGSVLGYRTVVWSLPSVRPRIWFNGERPALSRDGGFVFTRTNEGPAAVWDIGAGPLAIRFGQPTMDIQIAAFTPGGLSVVTVGPGGIQVYSCDVCLSLDRLRALADQRIPPIVHQGG